MAAATYSSWLSYRKGRCQENATLSGAKKTSALIWPQATGQKAWKCKHMQTHLHSEALQECSSSSNLPWSRLPTIVQGDHIRLTAHSRWTLWGLIPPKFSLGQCSLALWCSWAWKNKQMPDPQLLWLAIRNKLKWKTWRNWHVNETAFSAWFGIQHGSTAK